MNITEANYVSRLLRLLDGSAGGRDPEQIIEAAESLAERIGKPLQVTVTLNTAALRRNVDKLLLLPKASS